MDVHRNPEYEYVEDKRKELDPSIIELIGEPFSVEEYRDKKSTFPLYRVRTQDDLTVAQLASRYVGIAQREARTSETNRQRHMAEIKALPWYKRVFSTKPPSARTELEILLCMADVCKWRAYKGGVDAEVADENGLEDSHISILNRYRDLEKRLRTAITA